MADVQAYFFIILTLLISTLLIRAFFKSTSSKPRLPPSPFAIPIIGHLHLFNPVPHQAFHKLSLRYGPVIRLLMGSVPCVVVSSPNAAKEFLKTCENSFLDRPYNSATECVTYGSKDFAFANHGFYWKFMKKIVMSQLLSGATIDLLLPVRQDEINRFYKSLYQKASIGKALDLNAELIRCSEEEGNAGDIRKLIFEITEVIDLQGFGKRVKDIHRRFDELVEKIISEHEEERKQRRGSQGKDILNMLMDITEAEGMEVELTRENIKAFILLGC
ncbi:cytochrome P450 [Artemisia annua]|uniref:Cytochrome P450 n=1 Tax=Artemisia annua TaxID=35608 RepID=A0A2U1M6K8_ARTAN|nr:cytochrome P450 [Artemisia annua]